MIKPLIYQHCSNTISVGSLLYKTHCDIISQQVAFAGVFFFFKCDFYSSLASFSGDLMKVYAGMAVCNAAEIWCGASQNLDVVDLCTSCWRDIAAEIQ